MNRHMSGNERTCHGPDLSVVSLQCQDGLEFISIPELDHSVLAYKEKKDEDMHDELQGHQGSVLVTYYYHHHQS